MFTGIVSACGTVVACAPSPSGAVELVVKAEDGFFAACELGESVCVDGCCLSLSRKVSEQEGAFELSPETRARTAPLAAGDLVHLEPSLRLGDKLGGHFVFGHVDGIATVTEVAAVGGNCYEAGFALPAAVAPRLVAPKGSVAVAGVSLTVARVAGEVFWVQLVPATWRATKLAPERSLAIGAGFNLEIDQLARYVEASLGESR